MKGLCFINYIIKKLLQDKFWIQMVMIGQNMPGNNLVSYPKLSLQFQHSKSF